RANLSFIFWTLYFILQVTIVGALFKNWMLLLIFSILTISTGLFTLIYHSYMKKILGRWRLLRMVRKERGTVEQIMEVRSGIVEEIRKAKQLFLTLKK
ncbi:MAG: hypothetical protein NTX97_06655, partial [Bacteroidetes bacterium]|nr:hypothetical protein [Bacteroidota bacterium]